MSVKRRDLLKILQDLAKDHGLNFEMVQGGNHTKVTIGRWSEPVPRHREINEILANKIIRRCQQTLVEEEK